jgi:hypothetical protein
MSARLRTVIAAACVLALAGCGGSTGHAGGRTAAFVALANKICREVHQPGPPQMALAKDQARMRTLLREDARLPSLHVLLADVAAARKLFEEQEPSLSAGQGLNSPIARLGRANARIAADEKVLGMTDCSRRRAAING